MVLFFSSKNNVDFLFNLKNVDNGHIHLRAKLFGMARGDR